MHWIAYDPNEDHYLTILAFDFEKEEFWRMAFPKDESNYVLTVVGGCLCVLCGKDPSKMWVMKEYGVETSWTMMDSPYWARNHLNEKFKCQPLNLSWVNFNILHHGWFKHDANLFVETLVSHFSSHNE